MSSNVFFLRRVASFAKVLLSSKSYFICWGACLLSSKSCSACWGICLASLKVYFAHGVAWLVGLLGLLRGGTLSLAFSVSINKLKIYE